MTTPNNSDRVADISRGEAKWMLLLNDFRLVDHDDSFMRLAACKGMGFDNFFPDKGGNVQFDAAQQVCNACPVRKRCLEYALNNEIEHGVWGGTSPTKRMRLLRERRTGLRLLGDEREHGR